MPESKKQRILKDACEVVGAAALREGLKTTDAQLEDWVEGREVMPDRKLSDLSALLLKFARAGRAIE